MKKYFLFLLIGFLLVFPIAASANIIETVILNEGHRNDTGRFLFPKLGPQTVYDDYTASISDSSGINIKNGIYESFCVEDAWTSGTNNYYTVLTIDSSLSNFGLNADDFFRASWIAETYYKQDKAAAQIAIWEIMFDEGSNIHDGKFQYISGGSDANATLYLNSAKLLEYDQNFSSNWVLAVNPTVSEGVTVSLLQSQNYIFRASDPFEPDNPTPTPEPATMLLFGIGLLGIAGVSRRKE